MIRLIEALVAWLFAETLFRRRHHHRTYQAPSKVFIIRK